MNNIVLSSSKKGGLKLDIRILSVSLGMYLVFLLINVLEKNIIGLPSIIAQSLTIIRVLMYVTLIMGLFFSIINMQKLGDRIVFHGQVPHQDVFKYMRECDALVLNSHETFGMVYVDAMSQGCIPIGVKNDGIDGVVVNGKNGYLTKLGDYKELGDLLDSFANMGIDKISSLSIEAFNTAKQMTNESLAKQMIALFSDKVV